jgi:hypothetical protein
MTREHRQEALSRAYIRAVAALAGVTVCEMDNDYGIDLGLRMILTRENRRRDGSLQLDIQLKSITRANVTDDHVVYDLEVENYRDLRSTEPGCPRILVVLVLPQDEADWLGQSAQELTIRHCAYWMSLRGLPDSTAVSTVRVALPTANIFSVLAVQQIMQQLRERRDL